jgi:hypothetical protein
LDERNEKRALELPGNMAGVSVFSLSTRLNENGNIKNEKI